MTEEEIRIRVVCAVLAGRCASYYHSDYDPKSFIGDAFEAADEVVRRWRREKDKEILDASDTVDELIKRWKQMKEKESLNKPTEQ